MTKAADRREARHRALLDRPLIGHKMYGAHAGMVGYYVEANI